MDAKRLIMATAVHAWNQERLSVQAVEPFVNQKRCSVKGSNVVTQGRSQPQTSDSR
jgi:hypothetical protein